MKNAVQKYQKIYKSTQKKKEVAEEIEESASVSLSIEARQEEVVTIELDEADEDLLEAEFDEGVEVQLPPVKKGGITPDDSIPVNTQNRDTLIREYGPLIKFIAQKIAARLPANIELDDLISAGVIGLMDAIDKYDPTRDNKFKTYAEFRIRGAILDELRAQDWVPRSVREKSKMLERTFARLEQEKGRAPTDEELCAELNCSQDEYYELLNQVRSVSLLSYEDLNTLARGDRRSTLGQVEGGKSNTPYSEVNTAVVKKQIAEAIRDLPEKQRLVLSLYYYEDLNLKEIGKVLDVTESRVSQLHTQAILRLKARLKNNFDEFMSIFGG